MIVTPMNKTCLSCGKMYSWNPKKGIAVCPYCGKSEEIENIKMALHFVQKIF